MIEKLTLSARFDVEAEQQIVAKINELIEAHNKLEKRVIGQAYENDPLNRIG